MEVLIYLQGAVERVVTAEEVARNILEGHWYYCDASSHLLAGDYGESKVFVYHRT